MESTTQGQDPETPKQRGPKRSRTGCLTCRTRRRKCDETKPRCQNCVSKGLECRYAAPFQILGKNNYTPEVPNSIQYTNLKFVSDVLDKDERELDDAAPINHKELMANSTIPIGNLAPQETSTKDERNKAAVQAVSPSAERYEFALHGLLALGNGNVNITNPRMELPQEISIDNEHNSISERIVQEVSHAQTISASFVRPGFTQLQRTPSWSLSHNTDSSAVPELSDEQLLELFKHYRYRIAPWLDIIDLKQSFGTEVMQLSKSSSPVRYAVLALADQSLNGLSLNLAIMVHQHPRYSSGDMDENAVMGALNMAKSALADLSLFWLQESAAHSVQCPSASLLPEASSSFLASAAFWIMARLQLSTALMSPSPLNIPLPESLDPSLSYTLGGHEDQAVRYAQEAIGLCIDATSFSRGDEDRWLQQRYSLNRVELWRKLVAKFDVWYKHRPSEFHPLIELYPRDGRRSDDEFPILVFSNGAATFANQLYHTGMLLLLQNKPRFVTMPRLSSSTMSLLWQTHRVCGIAVNNDRWDCWDPCLVASFLVAAKTVTHQSQHSIILSTLTHIRDLTGWNINHHIDNFRREWQHAVDW